MIITKISDGFGNQVFMYACGYAVSKRLNTGLILDATVLSTNPSRSFELDKLNVEYDKLILVKKADPSLYKVISRLLKIMTIKIRYKCISEESAYSYNENITSIPDNTYLQGYWQSEKYFSEYRNDLIKLFRPKYGLSLSCKKYIQEVEHCNSVAVHVRRGDYNKIGICLGKEYYHEAINKIFECVNNPTFYIFSDDIDAAKKLLQDEHGEFIYVQYSSDNLTLDDFFIMKACKHQIIANSSYSWWAAWLNENSEKVVVCPEYKQWTGDFYPEDWILIKCFGGVL